MKAKRAQNKIAESRFALTISCIYTIIVCLAGGLFAAKLWIPIILLVFSTMLMAWLNNNNALIRIYSRMVSCAFLLLTASASFLIQSWQGGLVSVMVILSLIFVFQAYQNKKATGLVFYSFVAISIASIFFVQILYFVPILWILLFTNIMAGSWRTFMASILGLIAPYWFASGYYIYEDNIDGFIGHFVELVKFEQPFNYTSVTDTQTITLTFITILTLTGIIHFLRNSYRDKIRVRMLFEYFITMNIFVIALIFLQPQLYNDLLRMLIIYTAPLIGHFIALTNTKVTNIAFHLIVITTIAITIFNIIWTPSTLF